MAYVRKRGRQLALVHGRRDPESGKVEQEILFTLYSKAEALAAMGKTDHGHRFEALLEGEYPDIRFDWKKIRRTIADNLSALPDLYDYREQRLVGEFRKNLHAFTRSLLLADPQWQISAAELLSSHRTELEWLKDWIEWRLDLCDRQERNDWNADNPFYWRYAMHSRGLPIEVEERIAGMYQRREYDRARPVLEMLCEVFAPYAEGHNYLGLIACDEGRLDDAVRQFETTMELGRKLFPKRIAKSSYWSRHETRPYMRGLRNLIGVLNETGSFDRALSLCDRMEQECGDLDAARVNRARILSNMGCWQLALDNAAPNRVLWPEEGFIAAFAARELGRDREAIDYFLHASLNHPRAARMLLDYKTDDPDTRSYEEVADHNAGVALLRALRFYRGSQRAGTRGFFKRLLRHREVKELIKRRRKAIRGWRANRSDDQTDFRTMQEMATPAFAEARAGTLAADLLP